MSEQTTTTETAPKAAPEVAAAAPARKSNKTMLRIAGLVMVPALAIAAWSITTRDGAAEAPAYNPVAPGWTGIGDDVTAGEMYGVAYENFADTGYSGIKDFEATGKGVADYCAGYAKSYAPNSGTLLPEGRKAVEAGCVDGIKTAKAPK